MRQYLNVLPSYMILSDRAQPVKFTSQTLPRPVTFPNHNDCSRFSYKYNACYFCVVVIIAFGCVIFLKIKC